MIHNHNVITNLSNNLEREVDGVRIMVKIQTYVFIDLETTGVPRSELNKTRITEISLVAVKRDHLLDAGVPRVQHKLTLCLNPRRPVSDGSTEITGLCNFLLEYEPEFNQRVFSLLDTFLGILSQPVCFVAYNGLNFDYPILQNHLVKLQAKFSIDVLCADCLHAFYNIENKSLVKPQLSNEVTDFVSLEDTTQENPSENDPVKSTNHQITDLQLNKKIAKDETDFYTPNLSMQSLNETTPKSLKRTIPASSQVKGKKARRKLFPWTDHTKPEKSYKLMDVYERILKKPAKDAHRAEADCLFCLEISSELAEPFVEWVDNNHKKFADIDPMMIGVPI